MKKIFLFLSCITFLVFSCNKDELVTPPIDKVPIDFPIGNTVTTSVYGMITSDDGQAIANATVKFGDKTTLTDERGVYAIENATVSESYAHVQVTQTGYFNGNRTFSVRAEKSHQINIQLLKEVLVGSVSASGGSVDFEGVTLNFTANSIVDADGNAFAGETAVFAKYIDPTASEIALNIPGGLLGWRVDETEAVLNSYGMVAVELTDELGNELNIAEGKTVDIVLPIPSSLQASAPATIPIWSFDESVGVWVEEGQGTLSNGAYEFAVSHFSFWNCDVPFDAACVEGIVTVNGRPLPNIYVEIVATNETTGQISGYGLTDVEGWYGGKVPANTPLTLVIKNDCFEPIATVELGEISGEVDLGVIDIDSADLLSSFKTIKGNLLSCEFEPIITGGYVLVSDIGAGEKLIIADETGYFEDDILICESLDFSLIGINANELIQSNPTNFTFQDDMINVGNIVACGADIEEYVSFSFNGEDYFIVQDINLIESFGQQSEILRLEANVANNPTGSILISFAGSVGTQTLGSDFAVVNLIFGSFDSPGVEATIFSNDGIGGKVTGVFQGEFVPEDPDDLGGIVTGSFSAILDD